MTSMVAGPALLSACSLYFGADQSPGHGNVPPDAATRYPDAPSRTDAGPGPGSLANRWLAFDSNRGTFNRDIYLVRGDGSDLRQLTTESSSEQDPAFSHDGTTLAFASDRSGSLQIHLLDLVRGSVTQLTSLAAGADEPSWSRDDKTIVFHSGASVYSISARGGQPQLIATGLDDFNAYKYPSFSLDGREVIFSRNNEIDAFDLATHQLRYIVQNWTTTEETPALSPNGELVAYAVGCYANEMLAAAPYPGPAVAPCTSLIVTSPGTGAARRPAWATDSAIAFERTATIPGDRTAIVISITDAPGSQPRDIVGPPGDNRDPSWAPEGFQPRR